MSQINVATVASNAANTPPIFEDNASREIGQLAAVWVNFNGTGTVAINDSFNTSSITDNGSGDYTVNFTNNMANANYGTATSYGPFGGTNPRAQGGPITLAVGSVRVLCGSSDTGTLTDTNMISVTVYANN